MYDLWGIIYLQNASNYPQIVPFSPNFPEERKGGMPPDLGPRTSL